MLYKMVMSKLTVYEVFDDFWTFNFSTFSIFHFLIVGFRMCSYYAPTALAHDDGALDVLLMRFAPDGFGHGPREGARAEMATQCVLDLPFESRIYVILAIQQHTSPLHGTRRARDVRAQLT